MKYLLFLIFSALTAHAKIYDCFTFFNELEILEVKLNELYDHVDYFVLVESVETFRGDLKPLYFLENKDRFAKFLDKIIHVPVFDRLNTNNPWDREFFQRNQIMRGLLGAVKDDIIIIEDLDEMISAEKLPEFVQPVQEGKKRYVTCNHPMYTYYLNRKGHMGGVTHLLGSIVIQYGDLLQLSPQGARNLRSQETAIKAGWHFTYMGGFDRVCKKIESFSHSEMDNEVYKNYKKIRAEIDEIPLVEIDESYPKFIQDNLSYFKEIGFIDVYSSLK
jgi:hypothetical protein